MIFLVASEVCGLDEVASALGAGSAAAATSDASSSASAPPDDPEGFAALRVALHLNLAQAALKMSEWAIARTACQWVLASADATSVKALYRLAKAHEGEGELKKAAATCARLLKLDED